MPRTGSTTARDFLDEHSEIRSIHISKLTPDFPFYHHISALELKGIFTARGWDWDGYRKFCVVRNPYDRVVSLYHHRFDHLKESPVSFKQFVFLLNPENRLHTTLKDFICDDNGQFLVHDILKFEDLAKQLPDYLKQAGINSPSDSLPHLNPSKSRRPYRDYYDAESEARVSMLYQYEIKRFGYVF